MRLAFAHGNHLAIEAPQMKRKVCAGETSVLGMRRSACRDGEPSTEADRGLRDKIRKTKKIAQRGRVQPHLATTTTFYDPLYLSYTSKIDLKMPSI